METVYLIYGVREAKNDPVLGPVAPRRVNISVHKTFSGLGLALVEYNRKIVEYKDPATASWTYNWDFDYVEYETFQVKE